MYNISFSIKTSKAITLGAVRYYGELSDITCIIFIPK